jgi:hypothetical protein
MQNRRTMKIRTSGDYEWQLDIDDDVGDFSPPKSC